MAIIQISKLQQRSGNLVDLPQLDDAEFGWATDTGQLYIGKASPAENIEVLTSYSNISFSQITDSGGNIFVSAAQNGQILGFDGTQWVNKGGVAGGLINLGNVANVKMSGGSIGYVLETDGTGNLAWTSKGVLVSNISAVTKANPGVVTTVGDHNLPDKASVTITDVVGMVELNGNVYFANVLTGNTFSLYSDPGCLVPVDTSGYTTYVSNGRTVSSVGGGGTGTPGGSTYSIQYNNGGILSGDSDITWNSSVFTVNGNANVGNLNSYRLFSNVATGTTPIVVTSTTPVANLAANVSIYGQVTTHTTSTFYPVFASGSTTANYALGSNSNLSFNAATGALSATLLTGTLTTAAQPNVTSVGTLAGLVVSGHITPSANITYNLGNNTNRFNDLYLANSTIYIGSQTISANSTSVNISGVIVANVTGNATTAGTVTTAAQPNITSVGTLSALAVTGNISGANLTGTHYGAATGLTAIPGANVTGTVANATYAVSSGTAGTAGTVTTAAQPNITSVGTLTSLTTSGVSTLGPAGNVKITGGSNTQILQTDGTGNLSWANATGGYYLHTQTPSATTWTVTHNLGKQFVNVEIVDATGNSYVGRYDYPTINFANANALLITFSTALSGYAVVVGGGFNYSGGISGPAGADTQVQFNDGGNMGANASLTFVKSTGKLGATLFAGSGANLTNLAGANVSGAVAYATTANAVAGANVSGAVAYATTANAVAGANVSGAVAYATTANAVAGANVSGAVAYATTANAIAGANVSGTVGVAAYAPSAGIASSATSAGTVTTAAQPNITSVGSLTSLVVIGNISAANFVGTGAGTPTVSSVTNLDLSAPVSVRIVGGGTLRFPSLTTAAIAGLIPANGDAVYNTTTSKFQLYQAGAWVNLTVSPAADLAEYYEADFQYEPGTVLEFGGDKEVTLAQDGTFRVAGVVSTNPSQVMNSECPGLAVAVALQGRVPTKVRGTIRKGDIMVSAGSGFARPWNTPQMGTVIGKALENFDGVEGVIEVAVGRL